MKLKSIVVNKVSYEMIKDSRWYKIVKIDFNKPDDNIDMLSVPDEMVAEGLWADILISLESKVA